MSIKERLEAKQRRVQTVPVQLSDPTEDHETWRGLAIARDLAKDRGEDDIVAGLTEQMAAAQEAVASHWVGVELQAFPRAEWEAATALYRNEDDDGDALDWVAALPHLVADSCTDPELQDAKWWQQQLVRDEWSEGDTDQLKGALLRLNVVTVEPHIPKG